MAWDRMVPVGREFGSLDFECLMGEDHRKAAGVFDPVLRATQDAPVKPREARRELERKPRRGEP